MKNVSACFSLGWFMKRLQRKNVNGTANTKDIFSCVLLSTNGMSETTNMVTKTPLFFLYSIILFERELKV